MVQRDCRDGEVALKRWGCWMVIWRLSLGFMVCSSSVAHSSWRMKKRFDIDGICMEEKGGSEVITGNENFGVDKSRYISVTIMRPSCSLTWMKLRLTQPEFIVLQEK